jgi:hypothetical protein
MLRGEGEAGRAAQHAQRVTNVLTDGAHGMHLSMPDVLH